MHTDAVPRLARFFTQLISESSGLSIDDTLSLAEQSPQLDLDAELAHLVRNFRRLLGKFRLPRRSRMR